MADDFEIISEQACFGGVQGFYRHTSTLCNGPMRFAVYQPPAAQQGQVPVLTFLAGLTCSEETFTIKAGAQRIASALGLMLVAPDTSPRNQGIAGEDDDWDFGSAAGFYLDATEPPWSAAYAMESYICRELQALLKRHFEAGDYARQGISGHSMGGHGALTLHLKNPQLFRSVSAFAPIVAPMQVPWGQKAFKNYLGDDQSRWANYDSCALLRAQPSTAVMLVDQGMQDQFLERELKPELLEAAAAEAGQKLVLRRHPDYDHSYYFIQSFIEDHLRHHADALI